MTAANLYAILEKLQPEVIFLEVPCVPADQPFELDATQNLECATVAEYQNHHPVILHPVDNPTPEDSFFRRHDEIVVEAVHKSYDFHHLYHEWQECIKREGFQYLNSERISHNERVRNEAMVTWLEKQNNKCFSDFYEKWLATNEQRDRAMVDRIYQYCLSNDFNHAVFLVGAAHRESIIRKVVPLCSTERKFIDACI